MNSLGSIQQVAKSVVQGITAADTGNSKVASAMASVMMKHIPKLEAKTGETKTGETKSQCVNAVWGARIAVGGTQLCVAFPLAVLGTAAGYLLNRTTTSNSQTTDKNQAPEVALKKREEAMLDLEDAKSDHETEKLTLQDANSDHETEKLASKDSLSDHETEKLALQDAKSDRNEAKRGFEDAKSDHENAKRGFEGALKKAESSRLFKGRRGS